MSKQELPKLTPEQQLELQNNCRELREREQATRQTIEELLQSNQVTTTDYKIIEKDGAYFILYGITITNQITQEAGTDFRMGKLDVEKGAIEWLPMTQDFEAFKESRGIELA